MSDELQFMMGNFRATFPCDRRYAQNHMWLRQDGDRVRVGMTSYALRLLQEVFFLEWIVNVGDTVAEKAELGAVESSKATAALFAPVAGTIIAFNDAVIADPGRINKDNYGEGWLLEIAGSTDGTLEPAAYISYLETSWTKAQALLKGQMNR